MIRSAWILLVPFMLLPIWSSVSAEEIPAGELRSFAESQIPMHWCPPGKFSMGSPARDRGAVSREKPQTEVTLSRGFWMGQTEVTQELWVSVMSTKPWSDAGLVQKGNKYPASLVSWEDAVSFCGKLTHRERLAGRLPANWVFRLPTEAEWEYACRAGKSTIYSFGDSDGLLKDHAWFVDNTESNGQYYPHLVATKKGNQWGLHDMSGNVSEWCQDGYAAKLVGGRDPKMTAEDSDRVFRGGGWRSSAWYCRSAYRGWHAPSYRTFTLGFRLALSSSEQNP
jgi:formylglycine-generating enzyme required for sulfatase activity